MSDAAVIAIITAIPLLIANLTTMIITIRNGANSKERSVNSQAKSDQILAQGAEIHELANNNLSKAMDGLVAANMKIENQGQELTALRAASSQHNETVDRMAQALADKTPPKGK